MVKFKKAWARRFAPLPALRLLAYFTSVGLGNCGTTLFVSRINSETHSGIIPAAVTYLLKTNFGGLQTYMATICQLARCSKLPDNVIWQQKISCKFSRLPFSAFERPRSFDQIRGSLRFLIL